MSTVNLYDVLNVSNNCSRKEIKNAYRILVKEFHPDKSTGNDEMFELVTHAYNILINPITRCEYDEIYTLSKQIETDHFDLKSKSKKHYELMKNDTFKKSKDDAPDAFLRAFDEMDRKHGCQTKEVDDIIEEKEAKRRLGDLQLEREQDDIESSHDQIFDPSAFDLSKFNAAFDIMHKGHSELIPHQGIPEAWCPSNELCADFSTVDSYEGLYANDKIIGNSVYGSIDLDPTKKKKITKADLLKISGTEYTKTHNYRDNNYNEILEEKLKEREFESDKFEKIDLRNFDTDQSCGGYGIFNNIGIKNLSSISWDEDDDIKTRYERLLELRKQI